MELDQYLADSRAEEIDEVRFRDATAERIGPMTYPSEIWENFDEVTNCLFREAYDRV